MKPKKWIGPQLQSSSKPKFVGPCHRDVCLLCVCVRNCVCAPYPVVAIFLFCLYMFGCVVLLLCLSRIDTDHEHISNQLIHSFVMCFVCFCLFTYNFSLSLSVFVCVAVDVIFCPLLVRLCAFVHLNSATLHLEHVFCSLKMSVMLLLLQLLVCSYCYCCCCWWCCYVLTWAGQISFYSYGER